VNQNAGKFKENLKLQNAVTLKQVDMGRKNFILSDSAGLQNLIEIQVDHVSYYDDLTWNDPYSLYRG
jgi:hypothetical protein